MKLAIVMLIVFCVTLPFGFWRAFTRKFSWKWFLAIHLPVPLVFLTRIEAHLSYVFIPCTCAAFFAGQFLGSYLGRRWRRGRVSPRADGYPPAEVPLEDLSRGSGDDAL